MKAMREGKKMSESEIRATSERLYRGVGVVEREGGTTPRRRAKEEGAAACTFTPKISAASRKLAQKFKEKQQLQQQRSQADGKKPHKKQLADDRGDVDDAGARRVGRDRRALHVHADHFSKIAGDSREFGASSVERDEDAVVVRRALQGVGATQGGDSRSRARGETRGRSARLHVPTGDVRRDVVVADGCREDADARFGIVPRATGTRSKDARGEGR